MREVRLKNILLVLLAVILTGSVLAQDSNSPPSLTTNPVYRQNCAKCHGKSAEGRTFAGPSLVNEKTTAMSAEDLRNVITHGKHRMPNFEGKLTSEQIDTLVEQIKTPRK